tara:strand:+ start:426 stop:680 length:255 start_codon:yes stop_codon:yes gene_type:complete
MGKKEKYGSYLCKVGYFDIRQKIIMPRVRKNNRGEATKMAGSAEVFVYQQKHQIAGPFKSHKAAICSANELLKKGYKYNKFQRK